MISNKVAMKAAEKSRFGKLVAYLLDPQGKKTRVGEVNITNCISTDTTWGRPNTRVTSRHLNLSNSTDRRCGVPRVSRSTAPTRDPRRYCCDGHQYGAVENGGGLRSERPGDRKYGAQLPAVGNTARGQRRNQQRHRSTSDVPS